MEKHFLKFSIIILFGWIIWISNYVKEFSFHSRQDSIIITALCQYTCRTIRIISNKLFQDCFVHSWVCWENTWNFEVACSNKNISILLLRNETSGFFFFSLFWCILIAENILAWREKIFQGQKVNNFYFCWISINVNIINMFACGLGIQTEIVSLKIITEKNGTLLLNRTDPYVYSKS